MATSPLPTSPALVARHRARRRGAVLLVAVVLAAHAALLDRRWHAPRPSGREAGAALAAPRVAQVRRIAAAAAAVPAAPAAAPRPDPAALLAPARRPVDPQGRPRAAIMPGRVTTRPDSKAVPELANAAAPPVASPLMVGDEALAASPTDTAAAPFPEGVPIPVYATALPPAATLRYALRRGAATGAAELRWQPDAGRYELTLQGAGTGAPTGWVSQGGIDAHGIAPERHAELRRGRELRAVNFQRGAGRISFSGPQHTHALAPGAQDRLSWMLQLAAIVAADPALQAPGARVTMQVAGTRGAADAWEFTAVAQEAVELPDGSAPPALHWRREAARSWDLEVDVWLDAARHHLPVRALLRVPGSGGSSEFTLLGATSP